MQWLLLRRGSECYNNLVVSTKPIMGSRYDEKVESYFDVYLRTPGLPASDISRALLARGNARRLAGERLLARAQQGMYVLVLATKYLKKRTRFPNRLQDGSLE